ncbi:hypothetical protein GWI33_010259, partial [Rhynchophorus ferrugineus]
KYIEQENCLSIKYT